MYQKTRVFNNKTYFLQYICKSKKDALDWKDYFKMYPDTVCRIIKVKNNYLVYAGYK